MKNPVLSFLACAGVVFVLVVVPASARVDSYLVGAPRLSFGSIELDVPDNWSGVHQGQDDPSGQALELAPPGDKPFLLLISTLPLLERAGPVWIRANVIVRVDDASDARECGVMANPTRRSSSPAIASP